MRISAGIIKTIQSVLLIISSAFVYAQTAEEYLKKGDEANDKEDYEQAIKYYTQAIGLEPSHIAYHNRGRAYYYKNQFDAAITDLSKAISLDPEVPYAHTVRSWAYMQKRQFALAIEDLTQALRILPNNKDVLSYRGFAYHMNNQFKLAIADYTNYILIDAKSVDAFINLGLAYKEDGQYGNATYNFEQALLLDPKSAYAYVCKGNVYKDAGTYGTAVELFKKAIGVDDKFASSYIDIMEPLARQGQFSEAAGFYYAYVGKGLSTYIDDEADPIYYFRFYVLAIVAVSERDSEGALNSLLEAEKRYTGKDESSGRVQKNNFAAILSLKGYILEQLDRLDEAKQTYTQALLINREQGDVNDALVSLDMKIEQKALADRTPPDIQLISPETTRNFSIEDDNMVTQIIGKARDESGITVIQINGKDIDKVEEDGLFITHLNLKPGVNNIIISATDKRGNTAEKTFTINGTAITKGRAPALDIPVIADIVPKYYAILIAEKDYNDAAIPDLKNPVNDAKELMSIMENKYSFDEGDIDTLFNRSRDDIMQVIVQRCNTLTKNDNLLIFYAGHGTAVKDKYGDVDGYWIPVSAKKGLTSSYISAEDINKALKQSNARHILLIADACYSGAFTRDIGKSAPKSIQKQYKVPSRKIMASGNLEPVPDNSRFLYHLKKALRENTEKYVSAKKLFDSFYDAILNNSDNLPQYAAIKNVGDEGGEFVFIKK